MHMHTHTHTRTHTRLQCHKAYRTTRHHWHLQILLLGRTEASPDVLILTRILSVIMVRTARRFCACPVTMCLLKVGGVTVVRQRDPEEESESVDRLSI